MHFKLYSSLFPLYSLLYPLEPLDLLDPTVTAFILLEMHTLKGCIKHLHLITSHNYVTKLRHSIKALN